MAGKPNPSGEIAYDALRNALRDGTYHPGDRLREEEVAERLSLSRTPVREALRRLESDGIVEHRPRVGAVVRQLSHIEVVELYEMRTVLECTAAEMAVKHAADAEFDALEALNVEIEAERSKPSRSAAVNQTFHRNLYLAGRNRFLLEASRALNNSLLLLGETTYSDANRIDVVLAEHNALITALKNRDVDAARSAAAAHLKTSLTYRLKAIGQ